MSYHLKTGDETMLDGVRRIARSQIDAAIAEIDDADADRAETVHNVRKRCKKLRGLLRLVRPGLPQYKAENRRLREAAASLSGVRDAQVMVETFDSLAKRYGARFDHKRFQAVRDALVADKRATEANDGALAAKLGAFRRTMVEAHGAVGSWTLDEADTSALAGGYGKTLRRGAKALRAARRKPTTERMHELRKRAKYHWYHLRLLREVWPAPMKALAGELDRLGDLLGDEHDLAVFQRKLKRLAADGLEPAEALTALAQARREELQAAGLALAERVFAGDAEAAAERTVDLWNAWRAAPDLADPAERDDADAASNATTEEAQRNREIERKFLVAGDDWRAAVSESRHIVQGYLANTDKVSLRVRITDDDRAKLTAKSADPSLTRTEVEVSVPVAKARALMRLVDGRVIDKRRHVVPVDGVAVEVDEFAAPRAGLVLAEVELDAEDAPLPHAAWIGREVTGDAAYYGATIAEARG